MKRKQPTAAILHYSCPPVVGGVEFVIEAHARLFAEAGYAVRLIVGKGERVHPQVRTVVIPEIASGDGPLAATLVALREGRLSASFEQDVTRVAAKLRRALRGVDVCMMHNVLTMHFNLVLTAALARIMEQPGSTRFIGWTHDSTFYDPHYKAFQRKDYPWNQLSQALPGCRYCVISATRRRQIAKLFKVPAATLPVIPDGVSVPSLLGLTEPVAELYHREDMHRMDLVLLTPTRIVRRKNLERGMEITAAFKNAEKRVRWMITGAPDPHNPDAMEYFEMLVRLQRKLGIRREVIFVGERFGRPVSNDDLRGLFALSDVLLFPSKQEGFGIPVLEGGLARLVLAISDIPVFREIGGKDAVYIRPNDSAASVARRILQLFRRSPLLVSRKRVLTGYSWATIFEDHILPISGLPRRPGAA